MVRAALVQVRVRPVVRGVTEIGRDGSHMLVAMGFREVDNVVANEVCSGAGGDKSQSPV